ncbi:ABC transporter permease [uncultured Parabacteroides sp.]|uniref:ABC transporter permease n=1 Tax=uncultured Parabacteroides sp. TaxID=512312 RepID=UPI00342654E3
MFKQYLKQAWQLMKQNRFFSFVYILGTALAISLVMVMAIVYYLRTADIAPENCRSRLLLLGSTSVTENKEDGSTYNWSLSYKDAKECVYGLTSPEKVTVCIKTQDLRSVMGNVYVQLPGSQDRYRIALLGTDGDFWQVFDFPFIDGKPYTDEDFRSGMRRIVISETYARKLFGTAEASGKALLLNNNEYRVAGVVKDASLIMQLTYADMWIPFTSVPAITDMGQIEGASGPLQAYLLAHNTSDFEKIRKELDQARLKYNGSLADYHLKPIHLGTNKQNEIWKLDYWSSYEEIIRRYLLIALVFLLVPAINLTGLISSRMQERIEELGLRKAFGARSGALIVQVLTENMLLTFLGGMVGLCVSYLLVIGLRNFLLGGIRYSVMAADVNLSPGMLLNLPLFFSALGICMILNLLSSLLPVWKAARRPIVESINDK